jgi:hypothetical protein
MEAEEAETLFPLQLVRPLVGAEFNIDRLK